MSQAIAINGNRLGPVTKPIGPLHLTVTWTGETYATAGGGCASDISAALALAGIAKKDVYAITGVSNSGYVVVPTLDTTDGVFNGSVKIKLFSAATEIADGATTATIRLQVYFS